jgi:AcrR family transcriptional regulator
MSQDTTEKLSAKARILQAAARVFGEEGIKGATTREIARVAEVNETTLFRNFATKELLLKAVVEKAIHETSQMLNDSTPWTGNLRDDLYRWASVYSNALAQGEGLLRAFIGETRRQPEEARRILAINRHPARERLIAYLEASQQAGRLRKDIDMAQFVDVFIGALVMGVLRPSMISLSYTPEAYIQTLVDVHSRGIEA